MCAEGGGEKRRRDQNTLQAEMNAYFFNQTLQNVFRSSGKPRFSSNEETVNKGTKERNEVLLEARCCGHEGKIVV